MPVMEFLMIVRAALIGLLFASVAVFGFSGISIGGLI